MPTKKCCCVTPDCLIGTDDFNRADSDSLGSKWVEVSGDWDIDNNTLIDVADGIVLTTYRQGRPRGLTYNYVFDFDVLDTASEWHVICRYIDEDNFDWIELVLDTGNIFPAFYRRVGGVDGLIMDITTHPTGLPWSFTTEALKFNICYSETEWSINIVGGDLGGTWMTCDVDVATSLPADTRVGFIGFKKGDFDNWNYYYHKTSNPPCSICGCFCESSSDENDYSCMPEYLTLTLHPIDTFPACSTAFDIVLLLTACTEPDHSTYPGVVLPLSTTRISYYSEIVDMSCWGFYIWFRLGCTVSGPKVLSAYVYDVSPVDGTPVSLPLRFVTGDEFNEAVTTSCNPIVMTFPDMLSDTHYLDFEELDLCCAIPGVHYQVIVTE